jgi:hypothetical protein
MTTRAVYRLPGGRAGTPYWLPDPSELGRPPVIVVEATEDGGFRNRPADDR